LVFFELVFVRFSSLEDMSKKVILSVLGGMLLLSVTIASVVQLRESMEKTDDSGVKAVENENSEKAAFEESQTKENITEVSSQATNQDPTIDEKPFQPFTIIEAPIICGPNEKLARDKNNKVKCKLVI
jgi:hypothetical protein